MARWERMDISTKRSLTSIFTTIGGTNTTFQRQLDVKYLDEEAIELIHKIEGLGGRPKYVITTPTRISAQAILDHYHRFAPKNRPIDELYMAGKGAHNPSITDYIQSQLPKVRLTRLDELSVPGDAKEAISFAWTDMKAIIGRPLLVPRTVETDKLCVFGKTIPGDNFGGMMTMRMEFGKGYNGMLPPIRDLKVEKSWTGKAVHDF
ncbi:hypothetical protein MMC28_007662 [Mycoblastus sanguinarius]|nr:hypothetical protein [Mycoblastus sanguinarius]